MSAGGGLTGHWARARNKPGTDALFAEQGQDLEMNTRRYARSLAFRRRLRLRIASLLRAHRR